MGEMLADKWIEVDIDALVDNLWAVRRLLTERTRLIAVVKADAYGLGMVETAKVLAHQGVDFFAVTFASEGLEMRRRGIDSEILVFSPVDQAQVDAAVEGDLTLTVASLNDYYLLSEAAQRRNRRIRVHLKLDTGLGRFGAEGEEALEIARLIRGDKNLFLEGLYTHFAEAAARSQRYTRKQFARFQAVAEALSREGIEVPIRHCCNSAAALRFPEMHLDAVRIGTLLGGQYPAGCIPTPLLLRNPYHFKARVVSVRDMPRGRYLGYYRTYRTRYPSRIAVVPVGFTDGLGVEALSRPGSFLDLVKILVKMIASYFNVKRLAMKVTIQGRQYLVRGKVFMQFCLVEMPRDIPIQAGEVVEVPVKRTLAVRNVTRLYLKGGKPVKAESAERKTTYIGEEGSI